VALASSTSERGPNHKVFDLSRFNIFHFDDFIQIPGLPVGIASLSECQTPAHLALSLNDTSQRHLKFWGHTSFSVGYPGAAVMRPGVAIGEEERFNLDAAEALPVDRKGR
jgi:hypothetical protein